MIFHLAPHGKMGCVLANGSLSSQSGGEGEIRRNIIEADLVDCIIAMPPQLFYTTPIPVSLWFISRNKKQKGKTLFIDARKLGTMVTRKLRELTDADIQKIADTHKAFEAGILENVRGFCAVTTTEEIAKQDYILTPGRYVGIEEEEDDGEPFEEKMTRRKSLYRTVFFIPVVTSVVAIAILFKNMFSPYQGLITNALYRVGFKGPFNWLGDINSAIFGVIAVNIWEWTGWSMLLYIAGISQISPDIKEAANIDGARGFRLIRSMYLPLLSPVHKSLVLLGIIGSLQTFALVYSMTSGGPNSASEMPGTYIFRMGFSVQQMGYASAISVVILMIALILTVTQVVTIGSGSFIGKGEK
jgi:ABC-type spermidine/putrescine transport system permease subunit II